MKLANLRMSLSGPKYNEIFELMLKNNFVSKEEILKVNVDSKTEKDIENWKSKRVKEFCHYIMIYYKNNDFLSIDKGIVKVVIKTYHLNPQELLQTLENLEFELATLDSIHDDWYENKGYEAPGFANQHFRHGWACAFQGEGHSRLVSRRWLDYGPWRVLSGNNDTTLIQFHDLAADADTALAQARIGHERMGISDTGGFIQTGYVYEHDIKGVYEPQEQRLKIVVMGREVSSCEMLDACAVRHNQHLGADKPLKHIAYVFMEEYAAKSHLHELWLRELECWAIIDGKEVRLDLDYHPTPKKQDWVKAVEARETNEK